MRVRPVLLVTVALWIALAVPARAQFYYSGVELVPSDVAAEDQYGWAVTVQGNRVLVGAPFHDVAGSDQGAVYAFRNDGLSWSFEQKLLSASGAAEDRFGSALAEASPFVAIGAPRESTVANDAGAVHIYRLNLEWQPVQRVEASDAAAGAFFGSAVAMQGNRLIVGSPRADDGGSDRGAVYVYEDTGTWVETQKISNPAATPDGGFFGATVSIDGDRIVIGAPRQDPSVSGAAYVYKLVADVYTLEATLVPGDLAAGDEFGTSVSIDGDDVAVGAVFGDEGGDADVGAVYIFEDTLGNGIWSEAAKLVRGVTTRDRFGQSVSIDGGRVVSGAYLEPGGATSGAVYSYERDGGVWMPPVRLSAGDAGAGQHFGFAVSLAGASLVAGAPLDDSIDANAGAAWEFELRPCRDGGVNRATGSPSNVMFVNGLVGDDDHELAVDASGPLFATMSLPPAGGNGKYFVHANAGEPDQTTIVALPSKLGSSCFEVLLGQGATPAAIWNNIGKVQKIGESMYFDGSPIADPLRAPSLFFNLPTGDMANLPPGTTITLQGAIIDPGTISPRGVSLTNATVLEFF